MIPEKRYTIHITRRQKWSDQKSVNDISLYEWISYVKGDFQMKLVNGFDIKINQQILEFDREGLSFWKVHSYKGEIVLNVWFDYKNGSIVVNDPNEETIKKMVAIAGRLGAQVLGDKGELYDQSYLTTATPTKPWWNFW